MGYADKPIQAKITATKENQSPQTYLVSMEKVSTRTDQLVQNINTSLYPNVGQIECILKSVFNVLEVAEYKPLD